ncbi:hypothetical protein CAPTEDRAFT_227634 [Capitella teleta]|uniref:Chitin-binding type-2 domain-containing protein n=1 Tax=Capitella teleta TaxID=283909 RepID=R7VHS4_CAPTE|nr:hypothetical protein CAPTEDRAFT_227634 [Capitella teleta]|eukprot:ELU18398.1 hypothetical protein CAPTEDRAFT_227634 [Capitella teleta]
MRVSALSKRSLFSGCSSAVSFSTRKRTGSCHGFLTYDMALCTVHPVCRYRVLKKNAKIRCQHFIEKKKYRLFNEVCIIKAMKHRVRFRRDAALDHSTSDKRGYAFATKTSDIDPCDLPIPCNEGLIIPNPYDCKSYLKCEHNKWIERQCGEGRCFDVDADECDHAPCQCTPSCDGHSEAAETTIQQMTTASTSTEPPRIDPCQLPMYCDEGTTVANPDDCLTYLYCQYGTTWIERDCPAGLCYDVRVDGCVYGPCTCAPACPIYTGPTTVAASQATVIPETCFEVKDCDPGDKFADRSDCEFYFECVERDMLHRRQCGGTLVFDIFKLDCTTPSSDFNCGYRCPTTAPGTTITSQMTSQTTTSRSTADDTFETTEADATGSRATRYTSVERTETTNDGL